MHNVRPLATAHSPRGRTSKLSAAIMTRARLPPFGRRIADLRKRGLRPAGTVWVMADQWPKFTPERTSNPRVVLPADGDPEHYDWRFLSGLDVIVKHCRSRTGRGRLRALLRALLRANPLRLIVADCEARKIWFIKSVARGIEVQI